MNKYHCKVEASEDIHNGESVSIIFELNIRAKNSYDATYMAEELVDKNIRNGKFKFPYSTADCIDCFSVVEVK